MTSNEDYFPRGGKKPAGAQFNKQNTNFLGAPLPSEKYKNKPKKEKRATGDDGYLSDASDNDRSKTICTNGISYASTEKDVLLLGRVTKITETKMFIALPCRMSGVVMACHINNVYNELLNAYVNDQAESITELKKLFYKGQFVAAKVLETQNKPNNKSTNIMLSLMPQHINANLTHSDVRKGFVVQGAVTSVEDHGYVIDLGIPNTRTFMKTADVDENLTLEIGSLIWCAIKKVTNDKDASTLSVSNKLENIQSSILKKTGDSTSVTKCLLPGVAVDFTIDEAFDSGVAGRVLNHQEAYIQRNHMSKARGKKPQLGQRVKARLLFVMPTTKIPFFSMKPIFDKSRRDLSDEQAFKDGEVLEDVQVINIIGRTIYVRLDDKNIGFISKRMFQVDEELTDAEVIAKSYPIGSNRTVRILAYHPCDYVYSCSDDLNVIKEQYFAYEDLNVGDVVDCTIANVWENGLQVRIGRLKGVIPKTHISDAGITNDTKKESTAKLLKKKFREGQQVKARVQFLDLEKDLCLLTMKPSLMDPNCNILMNFDDAEEGKSYKGFIRQIDDKLVVGFFNGLTATVPRKEISREPIKNLMDAFHVGQIVSPTIIKVDKELKKLFASLTSAPYDPMIASRKERKTSLSRNDNNEPIVKKKKRNDIGNSVKENDDVEPIVKKKKRNDSLNSVKENDDVKPIVKKKKRNENVNSFKENDDVEPIVQKKKRNDSVSSDKKYNDSVSSDKKYNKSGKTKEAQRLSIKVESDLSDAIETDIAETAEEETDEINYLTPEDLVLINFDDCTTQKNFKKRVVSLKKSINCRLKRKETIEYKIEKREKKGLTPKNKKIHTNMHIEKIKIEKRTEVLLKALGEAQEKLKEFPASEPVDFKRKKKNSLSMSEDEKPDIVNLKKEFKTSDDDNDNSDQEETEIQPKPKLIKESKRKVSQNKVIGQSEGIDKKIIEKTKEKIKVLSEEPGLEIPNFKDFWSEDADKIIKPTKQVEETDSSSSEDEVQEVSKKKRKRLTEADKVQKAREEEEKLREIERKHALDENAPQSSDQFERLLLANPNSSELWIAYMAFYLQLIEIDKARAVGRKALQTISFREEGEKLNVWLAMLNFEHRFGNKESQKATLDEALQMNDTFEIHSKMLDIYVETSQLQELTSLVDLMLKKYKRNPKTYLLAGAACFDANMVEKARAVMQKAITVLDKKEHIAIIVQFAKLERRNGDRERAEALLEQIVGVYPQRVDVWCVYVDMLYTSKDVENIRRVMERAVANNLPAKKMKSLYKKWIEVEEKIGDSKQIAKIRQMAMDFIEKANF